MYTKQEVFTEEMAYNMMYRSPIIHVTHPWYSEDYMTTLEQGIEAYKNGVFPTDELISHRIPFEQIDEAFRLLEKNPTDYIKGILTFRLTTCIVQEKAAGKPVAFCNILF